MDFIKEMILNEAYGGYPNSFRFVRYLDREFVRGLKPLKKNVIPEVGQLLVEDHGEPKPGVKGNINQRDDGTWYLTSYRILLIMKKRKVGREWEFLVRELESGEEYNVYNKHLVGRCIYIYE